MPEKKDDREQYQHWCECDCSQCEIGTHERCANKQRHMPKWQHIEKKKKRGSTS